MEKMLFAVAGLFLGLLVVAGIRVELRDSEQFKECAAKDGVFLTLRQGNLCIKKDVVIN